MLLIRFIFIAAALFLYYVGHSSNSMDEACGWGFAAGVLALLALSGEEG